MKIHHFQQFFTGPDAPGSLQPRALVKGLGADGHEVQVIAGDLNAYNEQTEPSEELRFEGGGRVSVHRVSVPKNVRRGLGARLATYLGYSGRAWCVARTLEPPDVVVGSIQPLFTGLVALRHARKHRVPFLLEVRDLWPDALVAKGALGPRQAAPLAAMADVLYSSAERIVCLTPGLKAELMKKGIVQGKIDIFTNGVDPVSCNVPQGTRERVRERLDWAEDFVAVYVGTHVEVTAIEVIVRAAAELRARRSIRFDLFGQGQKKGAAVALATELGLENIHFHDPVPKSEVPGILAAADVGIMTLFESPLAHIYFENKFVDYLGAGLPIAAAMGGEQAELIVRYGLGRVTRALDHEGLASLVVEMASDPRGRVLAGEREREFSRDRLLLPDIVERYAARIATVGRGGGPSAPPWDPFS